MTRLLPLLAALTVVSCAAPSNPAPTTKPEAAPPAATVPITSKSPDAVALFRKGEMLVNNSRVAEAADAFAEALKLDPNFALAHAGHGQATPGREGLKEIEGAAGAGATLPQAERFYIDGLLALRRNENAAARTAFARVADLAPGDWRGYLGLGLAALNEQKYPDAVVPLKKAAEIDPQAAATAQNLLGYAALRQNDTEQAIAAFKTYARALPLEPNPQDSLGEALLAAGRFKDSEAAFQKALELSPPFWNAHEGMAFARLYAGDWAGGRQALTKARDTAMLASDKAGITQELAAVAVAQHNTAEALKLLDEARNTPGAQPADVALVPVNRAYTLFTAQRYKEAIASAVEALKTADTLPPAVSRNLRTHALRVRVSAEAILGDTASAKVTSTLLDVSALAHPDDPNAQSAMHLGRGMLALAQKNSTEAKSHFEQCSREDDFCIWQRLVAAEKAGDTAAVTAARDVLLKTYKRDPLYLVIRSRLGATKANS
jgi:tetratricopeptide (TPR) repeat protein